ncbi:MULTISPECIES: hypothetical protein [unclassified Streptomyces]|uniref:hypothetical protein n=1 Tax=unclassified Streptomyces TaxID=2593676 RepID=UPI001EFAC98F|nr:hypothetical protein [Streptomyces sp. SceaMP-e96]
MRGWMGRAPWWAVALVLMYVIVMAFVGAASHIADLARSGVYPYGWAPDWLNLYWSSLAVFDSLAALLLISGRQSGVDLTRVTLATDLMANWYAAYGIQHSDFAAQPGLQRLTAFTVLVFMTGPFVRSRLSPRLVCTRPGKAAPERGR